MTLTQRWTVAAALAVTASLSAILGAAGQRAASDRGDTVATVTAPEGTYVDYSERVWYFTSDATGETLATVSGCRTEDSCSVSWADGVFRVERVRS